MAGDWIKMRVDLLTSPKVVLMSSALDTDRFRVIGGLLAVWSLFDTHSTDGRLPGYTVKTLDELVGWSGFSQSMLAVGWLHAADEGLALPEFDTHNGAPAKRRAQEADRKRKERELARLNGTPSAPESPGDLSANVADETQTREEKSREDIPATNVAVATKEKKPSSRGTRLPSEWSPTREYLNAALAIKPDMDRAWFSAVAHSFKDYWVAKPGKDATKVDWLATFRNWVRTEVKREASKSPTRPISGGPGSTREKPISEQLSDRSWADSQ